MKFTDVLEKMQWCRGTLSAQTVNATDFYQGSVPHYATTLAEYQQIQHTIGNPLGNGPEYCGAVWSLGVIQVGMGNLTLFDDAKFDYKKERNEDWFKWALTKWAMAVSQDVFRHWWDNEFTSEEKMSQAHGTSNPSIVEWNDANTTTREQVYKFMEVLQQDITLQKLVKLSELTMPELRVKFALFQELYEKIELASVAEIVTNYGDTPRLFWNWDIFTVDDLNILARDLMPAPETLKHNGVTYSLNRTVTSGTD